MRTLNLPNGLPEFKLKHARTITMQTERVITMGGTQRTMTLPAGRTMTFFKHPGGMPNANIQWVEYGSYTHKKQVYEYHSPRGYTRHWMVFCTPDGVNCMGFCSPVLKEW